MDETMHTAKMDKHELIQKRLRVVLFCVNQLLLLECAYLLHRNRQNVLITLIVTASVSVHVCSKMIAWAIGALSPTL